MIKKMLVIWFILATLSSLTFAVEDAPRISDKELIERLTRLEEGQKNILREIDKRFEAIDKRFDQLINIFIGMIAAFAGIVAVTIGFAIWDRRTALAPAIRRSRELEERQERIEKALRDFADREPRLAEALRHAGLL